MTAQALYQIFLDARHRDGTGIDLKREEVANLLTVDTLALGVVNQASFLPGFHNETADFLTPQFTLARQNIALGDDVCSTSPASGSSTAPRPVKALSDVKNLGFCHYLDLALTVGQTFSDVIAQQNTNVMGSATLGWRVDQTNWKVTLPVSATLKEYENVLGGRQDVLFQAGAAASYTVPPSGAGGPSLLFSLGVTYNRNFSTLSTATWHGFVVQPQLTIAFAPDVSVKP